jgi:uncharacterized protein YggE
MNNLEQHKIKLMEAAFGTVIVVAFLFIALFANQVKTLFAIGEPHDATNTITVTGTGKATVTPDIATFNFTVTQTASTVQAAQTAASTQLNSVVSALTTAGVASSDIQTTEYDINPHYETQGGVCTGMTGICTPSKSVITGYDVSQTDQVKVRDLTQAGTLFSTVGSLGVQNVDGLQFSLNDPNAAEDQARAAAITDAQTQAQTLAKQLGVKLVAVVGYNDESSSPTPYPMMYAAEASVGGSNPTVAPSVSTGQQQVTENVSVTYAIR